MDDRFNTAAGWFLLAGIVGLGLMSVSKRYYHGSSPERPETPGYPIEGVEVEGDGGEDPNALARALAASDAAAGESSALGRCGSCHTFNQGGAAGTGPNLYGVVGSPIGGHSSSFGYSAALTEKGGVWDYANLDAWLASPRKFAAGTSMSFAGISNVEERANILAYLKAQGGGPDFPAVVEEEAEDAAEDTIDASDAPVEGEPVEASEAVDAMSADEPVPSN